MTAATTRDGSTFSARVRAIARLDFTSYLTLSKHGTAGPFERTLDGALKFAVRCETSPWRMPWFTRGAPPGIAALRRAMKPIGPWAMGPLGATLRFVLWPFVAGLSSAALCLRDRVPLRRLRGRGWPAEALRCLWSALRWNIAPTESFMLRLVERNNAECARFYVFTRDTWSFHAAVQPQVQDVWTVDDKVRFARHCADHGLPTAEIVVAFQYRDTGTVWVADPPALPPCDLFRKPIDRFGGAGASLWTFDPADQTWTRDGIRLDEAGLIADSARTPCLVQRRVVPHPVIAAMTPRALPTMRIITLRFPDGRIAIVSALLRLPTAIGDVDSYGDGGIAAGIDLTTGVLGAGRTRSFRAGTHDSNPATGAPVKGVAIPFWTDVMALVTRAHATLPGLVSVGWDIAVTADGPVVIEANVGWNVESAQIGIGRGFGETIFDDWLLAVLRPRPQ